MFIVYYVAPGNVFPVLEPPYTIYRNPTCTEVSSYIAAREHPSAGSKQMATYQAVAQTQSSWSSSCERTSPRYGRRQMATYQAIVAQTQSSSSSLNLCCSVATQTWSAHVARSLLHTIYYASSMNAVWRTPVQRRPQTALLLLLYIFSRTRSSSTLAALLSLPLFFPPLSFSTKNKLAKLKGLLRVQPNGRRKDEPQRGFNSVGYYEV